MRWTIQAVAVFGLLALFTFQVDAASLREHKTQVGAALSADEDWTIAYEEIEPTGLIKDLIVRMKERLQNLRDAVRRDIEIIKESGVKGLAKDVVERIKTRLTNIRNAAKKIADKFAETELGDPAREVVKFVEDALAKIREMIRGKDNKTVASNDDAQEEDMGDVTKDLTERIKERVRKLQVAVSKELNKIKETSATKEELEHVRKRLSLIRGMAKTIAVKIGQSEANSAAKELIKQIENALDNIRQRLQENNVSKETVETPKGSKDQDGRGCGFLFCDDDIAEEEFVDFKDTELDVNIKEIIDIVKTAIKKKVAKIVQGGETVTKEALEKSKERFNKARNWAQKVAEENGAKEVRDKARKLAKKAGEALKKIEEALNGKNTPKEAVTERPKGPKDQDGRGCGYSLEDDIDVVVYDSGIGRKEKMLKELEESVRLYTDAVEKMKISDENTWQVLKNRFTQLRDTALGMAAKFGRSSAAAKAREIANQAEEGLKKLHAKKSEIHPISSDEIEQADDIVSIDVAKQGEDDMEDDVSEGQKQADEGVIRIIESLKVALRRQLERIKGDNVPKEITVDVINHIRRIRNIATQMAPGNHSPEVKAVTKEFLEYVTDILDKVMRNRS